MSLQYIIDGCNVTHHPKFLKNIPKKFSDSRLSLIELINLRNLCGSDNNLVWLIFDGYPDTSLEDYKKSNFRIIFSCQESADEKIKKLLELTDQPKNMVVVSDDKEVSLFARFMRAKSVSVEAFIKDDEVAKRRYVPDDVKLNYSQMHKINEELKRLWLE
jgi:hypothetical protein